MALMVNRKFVFDIVAFLYNENFECMRVIKDLAYECHNHLALNAVTYYRNFHVLKVNNKTV